MNQFYCEMLQLTIAVHRKPTTYNIDYIITSIKVLEKCFRHRQTMCIAWCVDKCERFWGEMFLSHQICTSDNLLSKQTICCVLHIRKLNENVLGIICARSVQTMYAHRVFWACDVTLRSILHQRRVIRNPIEFVLRLSKNNDGLVANISKQT